MKRLLVFAMIGLLFTSEMTVSAAGLKDIYSAVYYADSYQDLENAYGKDEAALYQHFSTYGLTEGRNMSPVLDVVKYREKYADLDAAFGDNWDAYVEHYFTYGIMEGRDSGTAFNPKLYLAAYPDLQAAFGNDYRAAIRHYLTYGLQEGRTGGNEISKKIAPAITVEQSNSKAEKKSVNTSDSEYITKVEILPMGMRVELLLNSSNQIVQEMHYTPDGNLMLQVKHEYGVDGKLIKTTQHNSDGVCILVTEFSASGLPQKTTFYDHGSGAETGYTTYDYDTAGNQIQTNYDVNGTRLSKRKIEQTANGSIHTLYNADDSINIVVEYGTNGLMTKDTVYNYGTNGEPTGSVIREFYSNGTPQKETVKDAAGNVTSEIEYNEDGSVKSDTASAGSVSMLSLRSLSLNEEVMEGESLDESVTVESDENVDTDSDELPDDETETNEDTEGKDEVTEPETENVEGEDEVTEPEDGNVEGEDEVTEPEDGNVEGEGEVTEPEGEKEEDEGEGEVTEPEAGAEIE